MKALEDTLTVLERREPVRKRVLESPTVSDLTGGSCLFEIESTKKPPRPTTQLYDRPTSQVRSYAKLLGETVSGD